VKLIKRCAEFRTSERNQFDSLQYSRKLRADEETDKIGKGLSFCTSVWQGREAICDFWTHFSVFEVWDNITPKENRSLRAPSSLPRACSGDIYCNGAQRAAGAGEVLLADSRPITTGSTAIAMSTLQSVVLAKSSIAVAPNSSDLYRDSIVIDPELPLSEFPLE
jgi:hypothetical protein